MVGLGDAKAAGTGPVAGRGEASPLWASERVAAPLWASVSSSGKSKVMILWYRPHRVGMSFQGGKECAGGVSSDSYMTLHPEETCEVDEVIPTLSR